MQVLKGRARRVLIPSLIGIGTFAATGLGLNATLLMNASTPVLAPTATVSSAPASPVQQLAIGTLPSLRTWKDITLPVDSYREDQSIRNRVLTAEYAYTRSCAAEYGVLFDAAPPTRSTTEQSQDYYRLFGLIDPTSASQNGYHTGEKLLADGQSAPSAGDVVDAAESAPNYYAVVMGDPANAVVNGRAVPVGGCIGVARARLGDSGQNRELLEQAIGYGLSQSDRDPRVIKGFAAWSACMTAAGFSYATPTDANNDPHWGTTSPSSTEIATATADVNCKSKTGLTPLRVAVAAAWMGKFVTTNGPKFSGMKAESQEQLVKANALLAR